jgi:phage-related minor tail protein
VVQWFASLDGDTQKIILVIAGLVAAISPVASLFSKVTDIVNGVSKAFTFFTSPVGLAVAAIAAVIAIGVKLYQNWDTIKAKLSAFKDKWKQDWQQVKDFFAGVGKSIGDTLSNMVKQFSDKLSAIWNNVKNTFQSIGDWISKKLGFIVDLFGGMNWNLPSMGNGETYYGNNRPVLNLTNPSMTMPSQAAAVSEGTVINMTVNGGSVSANELADIVMDKLTNTIKRNNQRW